jgi:hypothetical protein
MQDSSQWLVEHGWGLSFQVAILAWQKRAFFSTCLDTTRRLENLSQTLVDVVLCQDHPGSAEFQTGALAHRRPSHSIFGLNFYEGEKPSLMTSAWPSVIRGRAGRSKSTG